MQFRMSVTPPSTQTVLTTDFSFDEDFDSLVMDTCQLLSRTDCEFQVSGLGQDRWPVDVSCDLSSVIEQLPEALTALREREPAQIDFYGQGIERLVTFTPRAESVVVSCTTNNGDSPDVTTETVPHREAEELLANLAREFKAALERACPEVAALPPFADW
ncbi:hypothetical protein [Streptomyces sp. Ru73]|uniref:hypothetical protein n=1 Tax=Streptomyces sp. Ru73 TaxID=2080748 RepID=UPI0011B04463|nr:hypothetical protein [Streptomyces sp. Ru73]